MSGCWKCGAVTPQGCTDLLCPRFNETAGSVIAFERELEATPQPRLAVAPGYEQLAAVLDAALAQAQTGKGKERHAGAGEAFHDQQIVQLSEWMGSIDGNVFQAAKKALEATRLPDDRAEAELLGAINYLAAGVIVLRRRRARSGQGG